MLERCEQARVLFTAELGSLDQMAVNIQRHLDVFVANEFLNALQVRTLCDKRRSVELAQILGTEFRTLHGLAVLFDPFHKTRFRTGFVEASAPLVVGTLPTA